MKRGARLLGVLVAPLLLAGCVERRFVVTSEPPGAFVLVNGQPIGATPADGSFVYYGSYDLTLVKDGYEPLKVHQAIKSPWYEYPGLDFIAENLVPWTIRDIHYFPTYQLQPQIVPRTDEVIRQAEVLQNRAATIGAPAPPRPLPPAPVAPAVAPPPPGITPPVRAPWRSRMTGLTGRGKLTAPERLP